MGAMITFSCRHCGYKREDRIGLGLTAFNPVVIGELLKDGEREEWQALSDSQELEKCFGEQVMAYCEECGELFNVFAVTGQTKCGAEHLWGSKCPKCGSRMKLLRDIHAIQCPSCRHNVLDAEQTGLWD